MTDSSAAIVWDAAFTPFGIEDSIAGTATNNQRFPGQYADAVSGLHYNWHRHYDPSTGRYITSDPIGLAGGLNTYGYVGGNPVMYVDATGENPLLVGALAGAAIFGAVDLGLQLYGNGGRFECLDLGRLALAGLAGAAFGNPLLRAGAFGAAGREIAIGKNIRIAPFGNRSNHPLGKWPHYHRRGAKNPETGETLPGQGIGHHRPLEKSPHDKTWRDRF